LTLDVALRSSGTVTGQVLQADRVTPASPSTVTINVGGVGGGTETTTSDAQGKFSFQNVPAGSGTISARVLGGIDEASAPINVAAGAPNDCSGKAQWNRCNIRRCAGLQWESYGGQYRAERNRQLPVLPPADRGSRRAFSVPKVLAGPFTAKLSANIGGFTLYGTTTGSVVPDQTANVTVQVQPSGTITGLVLRPDGQTPCRRSEPDDFASACTTASSGRTYHVAGAE